jgi:signal peptidase I
VSDLDEPIDPLDPRFVEAVLARARQRAVPTDAPPAEPVAAEPPATPPATTVPVVPTAPTPPAAVQVPPAVPTPAPDPAPFPERAVAARAPVYEPVPLLDGGGGGDDTPTDLYDDDEHGDDADRRTRNIVEWIAVAIGAVVVAFLIRAFLLQAFYIPSESMEPTLRENDRILVNKLSYKLHDINRGDLVVFEKPPNEPASDINDLIKRVIARPGETIELHDDGTITIDDRLLSEPYLRDGQEPGQMSMARDAFVEGACTNTVAEITRCTVGEDFVWVMGDNRNHSHDSRAFGPINQDLVVGRAFVKVWPLSKIGFL